MKYELKLIRKNKQEKRNEIDLSKLHQSNIKQKINK